MVFSETLYIFYECKEEKNAEILLKNVSTRGFLKELKVLLHYYLSFPLGNAGVERKFSIMNSIKTNLKTNMKEDLLDALMMIRCNGPSTISD